MTVLPVDHHWVYVYLFEPFLEGIERVNRAWAGVNFNTVSKKPLPLTERIVSWLIGTALLIPLLNGIIWTFWQTFGKPEKLSAPFEEALQ
jgi:hypothetical protein